MDTYEKIVLDYSCGHLSYEDGKELLMSKEVFSEVDEGDRWDLIVDVLLMMSQEEYSGSLMVTTDYSKFEEHLSRLCCGIFARQFEGKSGKIYYVGFDYGH